MQNRQVTITRPDGKTITFSQDLDLKYVLDKIKIELSKKNKDCVCVIDGNEGGGKSTLAFQVGVYVDPSLDLSRVTFSAQEFREAIFKAKKGQCVIYDEAFTGLASRSAVSQINKMLVSLMMQMRQKNLFVIVVLPTLYLLDKYVALFRSRFLLHVYEVQGNRGYFRLFGRKNKTFLYLNNNKTYTYKGKANARGRFYGVFALGDEKEEEGYTNKKLQALEHTEKEQEKPMSKIDERYKPKFFISFNYILELTKKSIKDAVEELNNRGAKLDYGTVKAAYKGNVEGI